MFILADLSMLNSACMSLAGCLHGEAGVTNFVHIRSMGFRWPRGFQGLCGINILMYKLEFS